MENNENENRSSVYTAVPAEVSPWTSFKNFLFQELVVELTPKQEKVFKEVRDFWTQEIYVEDGIVKLRPYSLSEEKLNVSL